MKRSKKEIKKVRWKKEKYKFLFPPLTKSGLYVLKVEIETKLRESGMLVNFHVDPNWLVNG